ncbi:hypothetical protein AYO44_04900 [Planctomycetaceae bacterium SCGC AG-212-F19]|nr:hypothetical protein AYO44_04900 [Planctomycetaceae bacterium SCGC AG-212-F19]
MLATPIVVSLLTALAADAPGPKVPVVYLYVHNATVLKMASGKLITEVKIDVEGVVGAEPNPKDPAAVVLSGKAPGKARLDLTDKDGGKESFQIIVARQVAVPLGATLSWNWPANQAIQSVAGQDAKIIRAQVDEKDARRLRLEPLAEGECFLTLTDTAGKTETVGVVVRKPNLLLEVGDIATLQPASKKAIQTVIVQDDRVVQARVQARRIVTGPGTNPHEVRLDVELGNPASVTVTAAAPGLAQLRIIDADDKTYVFWIGVKPKS